MCEMTVHRAGFYEKYIKRMLDIICALTALLVLSPVLFVTAALVRVKLGSPVIFKQERPGRIDAKTGKEKIFTMYKFRSMTDERDENGQLMPDGVRLTEFGRKLRETSLDELPELINIVKGDMSIVGPRPLLVSYLPLYNDRQRHRHDVRPGITGLAQIHGRNSISWEKKFDWDVKYVDRITFLGDCKIMLETIGAVLKRSGINSETSVTMEKFMGSEYGEKSRG